MLSQVSVILSTGKEVYIPQADTPVGRHPPEQTPPRQTPLQADNPLGRHPPSDTPPWADTLLRQTPLAADGIHPTGMYCCSL